MLQQDTCLVVCCKVKHISVRLLAVGVSILSASCCAASYYHELYSSTVPFLDLSHAGSFSKRLPMLLPPSTIDMMNVQGRLVASIGRGGKLGDTSSVQANAPQAIYPVIKDS